MSLVKGDSIKTMTALRTECSAASTLAAVMLLLLFMGAPVVSPGQTLKGLVSFNGTNGKNPVRMSLIQGTDGSFYGTTSSAGTNGAGGTVFKIDTQGRLTTLYSFCVQTNCTDGSLPSGGLTQAPNGVFYGTTYIGGAHNYGTIFALTPKGKLTTLHSFCGQSGCPDGANPLGLIRTSNGDFYGTTYNGGSSGYGTMFKVTPGGKLTTLHTFCSQNGCPDGGNPLDGLIQVTNGAFYGTTYSGGANGYGTVFTITPAGALTTLHSFAGTDGASPDAGLTQSTNGNFYGTTYSGGANGYGTVFAITPRGTLTTLHSFDSTDGAQPRAELIQATDGNFYGTTYSGGINNCGTVFEITPGGSLTTIFSFCGQTNCTDGDNPAGGLIQATSGDFYGTTYNGGTYGVGTVFTFSGGLGPFVKTEPSFGQIGSSVIVLGTNLRGATGVTFNATPAAYTVVNNSEIRTTVPTGAATGTVQVTTPGGRLNSNIPFQVTAQVSHQLMTISPNGYYLVNSYTNQPVFITGEDGWGAITDLDSADVSAYLKDRASRRFNAIWMSAVDNVYQPNPPMNYYGYAPFDGADFTNEDPNYWPNVDAVLTSASKLGITVFLAPAFVGSGPGSGYYTSYLNSSDAVMTAYGTFLGNRYKGYNNIVWVLGGDARPSVSGLYQKIADVGAGIAGADPNHLITLEACQQCVTDGYNSVQAFQAVPMNVPAWLTLDWAYPQYSTTVAACQNDYTQSPFLSPLAGENFYELDYGMTEPGLRFEMYSEVLSGCYLGRIFGNGAVWSFDSRNGDTCCQGGSPTWQSQLSSTGSLAQEYQGRLFRSRENWLLVPDINHTVVTGGYGQGLSMTTDARTSDGQSIIAYIPNGNAATITVDMSQIISSGNQAKAWWYDPQTAKNMLIAVYPNSGSQNFTPPDGNDWVLVIDDSNANLPPPGN